MTRPEHLPDYSRPPLDDVILGVQFASVPAYTSVDSKGVWDLFRSDFPKIQEHPVLDPQFETFGGANLQVGPQIIVGAPPVGKQTLVLILRREPPDAVSTGSFHHKLATGTKHST
ncbi:MAG: hypothetical protein Q8O82_09480 [Pseudorhodobacter sp.]|nr:hypothetical protein [Pseudorhodobacter sp.]